MKNLVFALVGLVTGLSIGLGVSYIFGTKPDARTAQGRFIFDRHQLTEVSRATVDMAEAIRRTKANPSWPYIYESSTSKLKLVCSADECALGRD